jgi:hypothetical protein
MCTKLHLEHIKGRNNFGEPSTDERIILKCILKEAECGLD